MAYSKATDASVVVLSDLTATSRQRRLVWTVAALQLVAFTIVVPFADIPWRRLDAFIPTLEGIMFVNDLITAFLLFTQYTMRPSYAILILASGYLFTALIVIPHALSFPFAFAPDGLLGGRPQTTAWLYNFWHVGSPAAILAYACLKNANQSGTVKQASTTAKILYSVVIVVSLVFGLTLLATAGERFLPVIFIDQIHADPIKLKMLNTPVLLLDAFAFLALWVRRRSVLDYWLMLVVCALSAEAILSAFLSSQRFSVGFYAGRFFSLGTSVFVLVLLLTEMTTLSRRLARTTVALERERDNKLMNLEAMAASIAHEVRQPLAAIALKGSAALRFLGWTPPEVEKVRSALNDMVDQSHRASQVFANIRALFGRADKEHELIDVSEITLGVLRTFNGELKDRSIMARTELTPKLPPVMGHRGQLEEVLLNLIRNAIEAMDAIKDGSRVLQVSTKHHGRDEIVVVVEDSGPGIDPKKLDRIFEAYVSTKPQGMGLGLAICRLIIDRHGGQLSVSAGVKRGAVFQFILPTKAATDQSVQTA